MSLEDWWSIVKDVLIPFLAIVVATLVAVFIARSDRKHAEKLRDEERQRIAKDNLATTISERTQDLTRALSRFVALDPFREDLGEPMRLVRVAAVLLTSDLEDEQVVQIISKSQEILLLKIGAVIDPPQVEFRQNKHYWIVNDNEGNRLKSMSVSSQELQELLEPMHQWAVVYTQNVLAAARSKVSSKSAIVELLDYLDTEIEKEKAKRAERGAESLPENDWLGFISDLE